MGRYDMHSYQGKLAVRAKVMSLGDYNDLRGWELPVDEDPNTSGYLVEYSMGAAANHRDFDGYISWMPTAKFVNSFDAVDSFKQRVKLEQRELQFKLDDLVKFLSGKQPSNIENEHWDMLLQQKEAMEHYNNVLCARLDTMRG